MLVARLQLAAIALPAFEQLQHAFLLQAQTLWSLGNNRNADAQDESCLASKITVYAWNRCIPAAGPGRIVLLPICMDKEDVTIDRTLRP